jgi:hypothetical protein
VGGYVKATTFQSTQVTGTAPFTVASTTAVANLQAATASAWHTARTVTFTGDVTGSFSIDGSADVTSVDLTVGLDKVALGTDTTGDYVATAGVSGNGLTGSSTSEGGTFTVSSNATENNTGSTIVFRDASGNFTAGTITATSFSGPATQVALTATSANAAHYLTFVDTTTGNENIRTDADLAYNPSTNVLTAGTFSGIVSGTLLSASSTATLGASTIEAVSINPAALTGSVTLDVKTNAVYYYTANASANWTLNFRGDGSTTMNAFLTTGQSATVVLLATQGGTAYYPTAYTVDGTAVSVTVEWLGGAAPTGGNASGIDSYSFTIIKTGASTYTVLASQARFA